jgi:hypothetical protein
VTFQVAMLKERILSLPIPRSIAIKLFLDALPPSEISLSEEDIIQIDRCLKCEPVTEYYYCRRGYAALNDLYCRNCGETLFENNI